MITADRICVTRLTWRADTAPRSGLAADAARALAALHASAFTRCWDQATFEAMIGDPLMICLIARRDETGMGLPVSNSASFPAADLVGFAIARRVLDEAELLSLAVAPGQRRQGIARRLLAALQAELQCSGECSDDYSGDPDDHRLQETTRLFLEVGANNTAARALYESHGFRDIGVRKGYYPQAGAPNEDALLMALDLNRR